MQAIQLANFQAVFGDLTGGDARPWSLDICEGHSGCGAQGGVGDWELAVEKIEEFVRVALHFQA